MGANLAGRFSKAKKDSQGNNLTTGSLESWIYKGGDSGEVNFEKLWNRSFNKEAFTMYWCESMSYLAIGLDDGTIVPIEIDIDNPTKYTELRDYKIHKGRVNGIFIDPEREFMFSVGDDKYLRVFDFKSKIVSSSKP